MNLEGNHRWVPLKFSQSLGPSLNRGSTVVSRSPLLQFRVSSFHPASPSRRGKLFRELRNDDGYGNDNPKK